MPHTNFKKDVSIKTAAWIIGMLALQITLVGFLALSLYNAESVDALHDLRRYGFTMLALGFIACAVLTFSIVRKRQSIVFLLRQALIRREFFVQYQPVVELKTGKWVGAEALIRWRRKNGIEVYPDAFIPAAEQSNLIRRITQRVLEFVAEDAPRLKEIQSDFYVSVNFSAADLKSRETLSLLHKLINQGGISSKNILVEATERGFIDAKSSAQIVHDIRAMGIHVAIDDFGTGYSGLSYLTTFELSYLKIDKSFMEMIGRSAVASQVVKHIIKMALALDLKIIAEGVENELQASFLIQHGVQYAQGWLFARPMPIQELIAGLHELPVNSA